MDGCSIGSRVFDWFPVNEQIAVIKLILWRFPTGVGSLERCNNCLRALIVQLNGRQYLLPIRGADSDLGVTSFGDRQRKCVLLVLRHGF